MSLKIRKIFNIKENLKEFTDYIGCNPKGIYYIESNTISNKHIRYFLFLRKKGYDINNILDLLLEDELKVSQSEVLKSHELPIKN